MQRTAGSRSMFARHFPRLEDDGNERSSSRVVGLSEALALPVGGLAEGHRQELLPAGEAPDSLVIVVALHQAAECAARQACCQLQENGLSLVRRLILNAVNKAQQRAPIRSRDERALH